VAPPARAEAAVTPRQELHRHEQQHETEEAGGELGRGDPVAETEPGPVDGGGEGGDAEILHRAEVGERLHQRQGDARGDGRPRHGQADAQARSPGAGAERAGGLQHAGRLVEEGCAGEEIDVRVEHQRQHQADPGEVVDLRKPVVAARPAEQRPHAALHRAGEGHGVRVGIADDVGRHGERQQQEPFEGARAGKRQSVTSQAVPTPITAVPAPTITMSPSVFNTISASTVSARWAMEPLSRWKMLSATARIGVATTAASTSAVPSNAGRPAMTTGRCRAGGGGAEDGVGQGITSSRRGP
jgi:hypothetical protein